MKYLSLLCFFLWLIVPKAGQAQEENSQKSMSINTSTFDSEKFINQLKGEDVPRYFLVKHFFLGVNLGPESHPFYLQLLKDLGIKEGSNAEALFRNRVEEAQELLFGSGGPKVVAETIEEGEPDGSGRTVSVLKHGEVNPAGKQGSLSLEEIQAAEVQEAISLAGIYCDLMDGLREANAEPERVDQYIYSKLAPGSVFSSDEPLDKERLYLSAFDERLEQRGLRSRR